MPAPTSVAGRRQDITAESAPSRSAFRHRRGFWLVGFVFLVTMAFSAVPAPLYVLYAARDSFGPLMITVIFAAYAVGVIASLFLAGHLSDWLGRRRMAVIAVSVNVAAGVIFLLAPTVPGLLVARVVSGISVGMLTATATAFLSELDAAGRGGMSRRRAEIIATAANLGGIGFGPLVSGFLAQYAGDPLVVPYLVFEALMLAGVLALALVPETVARAEARSRPRYRPQRVSVPAEHRPAFYAASAAAAAEFALFGLFTSLSPGFIAGTLHDTSHALAGAATFAVFGAGALAQIVVSRAPLRRQLAFGLLALVLGLVLITTAFWLASLALLLIGGIVAGGGAGAAFKGSVTTVLGMARPEARGEALAGLFLAAYVGLAVPVLALGIATQLLSARDAVLGFAVLLVGVVALVSRRLLQGRSGSARGW